MKRGISPLIAGVILIAFVIAVAGIASGFFTGFIKSRTSEVEASGETAVECGVANLEIQEDLLKCSAPNWDSMVARWHMDEGSGLTAYDSSQNSNAGSLIDGDATNEDGDTPPQWVNGKFGKALEFDGKDDYVDVDFSPKLQPSYSVSVSYWLNANSTSWDSKDIVKSGENWGGEAGWWSWIQGSLRFRIGNGTYAQSATTGISTNEWHHVVGTWDGRGDKKVKLYVDGSLVDISNPIKGPIYYLGSYLLISDSGRTFNGSLDSIRVYDKALSQNQVEYLYSHGTQLRFSILNKGQTNLGKNFDVATVINGTSRSESVSLDNSLDKAEIKTVTPLKNISTPGKLEKVRVASKACGSVYDSVEPEDVYC